MLFLIVRVLPPKLLVLEIRLTRFKNHRNNIQSVPNKALQPVKNDKLYSMTEKVLSEPLSDNKKG